MKFEICNESLLKVYKVMGGFVSKKLWRKILTAIHIVANKENQTVTFESSDSSKIARWIINTNVIENGECSIIFSKKLTYLLKLMKKPIPYYVVIYDEDGFVAKHYDNYAKDHNGEIPEMFNPYNEQEIKDLAPAQTTQCGSTTSSASVLIKNDTKKGYIEAEDGDGIDISTRMHHHRGTVQKGSCQTLTTMGGENVGVVVPNLKQELCDKLVEECKVQEGDVVNHSYSTSRLNRRRKVERQNEMPALTTRPDTMGVAVKDNAFTETEKELITEDGNIKRYIGSDKVDKFKDGQMATTTFPNGYGHGPRTHNESIALNTIDRPIVKNDLRIRKLVPVETMKLMGFTRKDTDAMREIGLSDAAIYHCAGDSIVSTVLIGIFSNLINDLNSHEQIINDYVENEIL